DGGNNVGMLSLFYAAEATIRKAAAHGIALISVNNAWMSGRSAYYVEMIASAGLVAIHRIQFATGGSARWCQGDARHESTGDCGSVVARAHRARRRDLRLHDDRSDATRTAERVASRRRGDRARRRANQGPDACTPRRIASFRRLQRLRAGADDTGVGIARRV